MLKSFLVVALSFSSVFGEVRKFGCTFKDSSYRVKDAYPVFASMDLPAGLKVGSDREKEMKKIFDVVEKSKREVFAENYLDEITPFVDMHAEMKKQSIDLTSLSAIEKFAHDYAPTGPRQLYMDMILKVVDKIKINGPYDDANLHFYFAGMTTSVSDESIEALLNGSDPYKDVNLAPTHSVGILKVELALMKPTYVIIDMEHAITPTPFIGHMSARADYDPAKSFFSEHTYTSMGDPVEFKSLDADKGYLQFTISGTSVEDNNTRHIKSKNLIYARNPFCSFLEVANWHVLHNHMKMVAKISPEGQLVAGISAVVSRDEVPIMNGGPKNVRERILFNREEDAMTAVVVDFRSADQKTIDHLKDTMTRMELDDAAQAKLTEVLKKNEEYTVEVAESENAIYEKMTKEANSMFHLGNIIYRVSYRPSLLSTAGRQIWVALKKHVDSQRAKKT